MPALKELSFSKALSKLYISLVLLAVFLSPLFFSPLGILELDKQTLLLATISLALILWTFLQVLEGRVALRISKLIFSPLPFLVALILSTIFARSSWGSFWGFPQDTAFNLLNFVLWISVFYLMANTFELSLLRKIPHWVGVSWLIVLVWSLVSFFKPLAVPTPFGILQVGALAGSLLSQAIITALIFPIYLGQILEKSKGWRVVGIIGTIVSLIFLGIVSFRISWLLAFFTSSFLLFLSLLKLRQLPRYVFVLSSFLFAISFLMAFFTLPLPQVVSLPVYLVPSWSWSLEVSQKVWQDSLSSLLFGWGPGSFRYAWSQFRPQEVLQTFVWNVRFTRPSSEIFNLAVNTGIVGVLSFAIMFGGWLLFSLKRAMTKKEEVDGLSFVLPSVLFGFGVALFLTAFNLVTWTLFWIFGALVVGLASEKVRIFNLSVQGLANVIFSFFSVVVLVAGISLLYLQGIRVYAKGLELLALRSNDPQRGDVFYLSAVSFSGKDESILQNGSLYFLNRAQGELLRQDISDQEKGQRAGSLIGNAVALINSAVRVNPANVANWETRGFIYRQIIGLAQGAETFAINSYEEALKREPNNPYFYVEMGRVYLALAQQAKEEQKKEEYFAKAKEVVQKAIELKKDYTPAYYQMASILDVQGKRKEAIQALEDLKRQAGVILSLDASQRLNLSFQLGVLYYNDGQYQKAKEELSQVIAVSPNFSNALYFLALSEAKLGETDSAISRLERVKELNKDNKEVAERIDKIISNIKEGKDPLEGVSQQRVQESLEEKPEEQ